MIEIYDNTTLDQLSRFLINYTGIYSKGVENINLVLVTVILNNLNSIGFVVLGSFIFGMPTFTKLFFNGYVIGVIIAVFSHNLSVVLLFLLPHGIFEIPAIIIAGAAGFKIPYEIVRYLMGKKEQPLTKEDIKEYLILALISIILIVIAAFVEAYITPRIAEYFLSKGI